MIGFAGMSTSRRAMVAVLAGGPPPVVFDGPVYDDFSGSGGLSAGRTTTNRAAPWQHIRYTGTGEAFAISGGSLKSITTNTPQQGFGLISKPSASGQIWTSRRVLSNFSQGNGTNGFTNADMVNVVAGSGAAQWIAAYFANASPGVNTSVGINYRNASNAGAALGTVTNCTGYLGDVIGARFQGLDGATPQVALTINGQRYTDFVTIDTGLNPISGLYGFRATNGLDADDIVIADPVNERVVFPIVPGKVIQRAIGGSSVTPRVAVRFSPDVPAAGDVRYTLISLADGLPIGGHENQPISSFVAGTSVPNRDLSANNAMFSLGTLASPPAAGFRFVINRLDVTEGQVSPGFSPFLLAGDNYLVKAQSLSEQMAATTAGALPPVTPVNCFRVDSANTATTFGSSGITRARNVRSASETTSSAFRQFCGHLQDSVGGNVPIQVAFGGQGATLQKERNESPTYRQHLGELLAANGFRNRFLIDTSGQYEVADWGPTYSTAAAAMDDYKAQMIAEQDWIDALCGTPQRTMIIPLGPVFNTPDADTIRMRKLQRELAAEYPDRFFVGPYVNACERALSTNPATPTTPTDPYHLTQLILLPSLTPVGQNQSGYGRQAKRAAKRIKKLEGWATSDENGPRLLSGQRISDTVVRLTFDDNGGTLNLRNTGYLPSIGEAADWRCGLDFSGSTGFSSFLFPTNAVVQSATTIDFTFAPTLPATVYVRAATGTIPFFRGPGVDTLHIGSGAGGTNAICLNPMNRASMVCSDYADGDWCEVQPSYDIGGADIHYVTAA
ncbi:MAG: hypothetical protein B7Y35_06040 [Sphingomonadales bacterium 28-64-96]|nr:MAG: hypothetical protein B7Y35_06040 [Sphingomonadales bacterium 28-64-96]